MLSDTLADAEQEISRYQDEYPDIYEPHREAIEHVKTTMRLLRMVFDNPFSPNGMI